MVDEEGPLPPSLPPCASCALSSTMKSGVFIAPCGGAAAAAASQPALVGSPSCEHDPPMRRVN